MQIIKKKVGFSHRKKKFNMALHVRLTIYNLPLTTFQALVKFDQGCFTIVYESLIAA